MTGIVMFCGEMESVSISACCVNKKQRDQLPLSAWAFPLSPSATQKERCTRTTTGGSRVKSCEPMSVIELGGSQAHRQPAARRRSAKTGQDGEQVIPFCCVDTGGKGEPRERKDRGIK